MSTVSVVLGLAAAVFHLFHILAMVTPKRWIENKPRVQALFAAGVVRAESHIKQSAAQKVSVMVNNALDLAANKDRDTVLETHFGQGLLAYEKFGKRFTPSGGFAWTWRRIFNLSLFKDEGIWLSARLVASNTAQFIVCVFVLIAGIQIVRQIEENYDIEEARRQVGAYVDLLFDTSVADNFTADMVSNLTLTYLSTSGLNETCTGGTFNDTISEALCSLLNSSHDSDSFTDGITALGLLDAAGFDSTRLFNTSQEYLRTAAEASVNSLYPNQVRPGKTSFHSVYLYTASYPLVAEVYGQSPSNCWHHCSLHHCNISGCHLHSIRDFNDLEAPKWGHSIPQKSKLCSLPFCD